MLHDAFEIVLRGENLDQEQARRVFDRVLRGEVEPAWLGGFLTALRLKGESAAEIAGFAQSMREHAVPIECRSTPVVDTCGTGGDAAETFNVSTATAFVVAAAGLPVAKHGNRSVSSRCGSADVLEALGARLDLEAEAVGRCVDEVGMGFLFAPRFHGAMRHAIPTRRSLRIRTVFNILGPITNPARPRHQVIGVFVPELLKKLAPVLPLLGQGRSLLVHGRDGLDELSVCAPNDALLVDGELEPLVIDPATLGLGPHSAADLRGGDAETNAAILREVFAGASGPRADIVALNAAAVLWTAGRCADLAEGIEQARQVLGDGRASRVLEAFVTFTREHAPEGP